MTDLSAAIDRVLPSVRADLEDLIRIPSVSYEPARAADVQRSAEATAALFEAEGFTVKIVRAGEGAPAVIAKKAAPPGKPTVLLYAHHDVQPTGPVEQWTSDPFVPTERGDRLYGRGAADDKAGIAAHLAAVRAFGNDLPVGVTVFVEGEEEIGSPTFQAFLAEHRELLAADVIVVADSMNWKVGLPALTTSLRGLVDGTITVRTLDHAVHSGMYGGAVPDAMLATVRLVNSFWDENGDVAVSGLAAGSAAELDYPEADLRKDCGVLDGVELIGTGSLTSRLWTKPALTVIGIDATTVASASNTLLPAVRVKFSLRIAPGQDPAAAVESMRSHVEANAPFGAKVEFVLGETGQAFAADVEGAVYRTARWALEQSWGTAPVHIGVGGSIPFIADLQEVYPAATVLVTGVEDPDSRAHGPNESLQLSEFERACVAEVLLLRALAG
jgi:acetylornithine deacetylase/succinyl-diaminopimelate desuccinylase-like protein